ncbi:uncharacterized protein EV420DRAFT_1304315 [Desarmillaria tabescens]|uniref:Uncharacterized protein n=1 Tax=Armillaria tabescens TaxID=1929756 RepID=A0AA39TTN9_ARMTA|nr:uncharacterized protein EV420DRAFT_1304315 [Desarmillaria tabescens]KAK0463244.1 hypothetical protein EV420DRAFT_1304315 [Desarmillaria tabescens]
MLKTKVASFFTLADVYSVLCGDPYCTQCGDFGPLLWLPECTRCCTTCLRQAPDLLPITQHAATKALGVPKSALTHLPTVCTVPGDYGTPNKIHTARRQYLSFQYARAVAVERAGGEAQCMARISASTQRQAAYDAFMCADTNLRGHIGRYMVTAPLPYFDKHSGKADRGIYCAGCRNVVRRFNGTNTSWEQHHEDIRRQDTVYLTSDFIQHIQRDCPDGQLIWECHSKLSKRKTKSRRR